MAAAYDAHTVQDFTTSVSFAHAPVGTPRGVVVAIAQNASAADRISAVTYGGVPLARVPADGFAADSAGEVGAVYMYFLGTGVPTGAQTVQVTVGAGAEAKRAVVFTITAATDIELAASGSVEGDAANPSVTLATDASFAGFLANAIFSGHDSPASLTGAYTDNGGPNGRDFGTQCAAFQWSSAQTGANVPLGWTAAVEDVAMISAAFQEIRPAPRLIIPPRRPT